MKHLDFEMSNNNYCNHWESRVDQLSNSQNSGNHYSQSGQWPAKQPDMHGTMESNQHSFRHIPPPFQFPPPDNPSPNHQNFNTMANNLSPWVYRYPQYRFPNPSWNIQNMGEQSLNINVEPSGRNFPHPSTGESPLSLNCSQGSPIQRIAFPPPFNISNTGGTDFRNKFEINNSNVNNTNDYLQRIPLGNSIQCPLPEEDNQWIQKWIEKTSYRSNTNRDPNISNEFKISNIQKKLLKFATTLKELEAVFEELTTVLWEKRSHNNEWDVKFRKSETLKADLEKLRSFFSNSSNIQKINEAIRNRKQRRQRWKRNKEKRTKRKRVLNEERREKESKINLILQQIQEEEREKNNEEKMKKEIDSILKEVRTKQEEALKMQKLMSALSKLRETRLKKGETHGYIASHKANIFFVKLKDEMDRLLEDQLNLYHAEEQTLKIMMEESKPCTQSIHSKKNLDRTIDIDRVQKEIYEALFGKKILKKNQTSYEKSFLSAEDSVEVLVNRRRDWDQFVAAEGKNSSDGSAVPLGWVIPNLEPNSDWEQFQNIP